jgi:hypothetical protein
MVGWGVEGGGGEIVCGAGAVGWSEDRFGHLAARPSPEHRLKPVPHGLDR